MEYTIFRDTMTQLEAGHDQAERERNYEVAKIFNDTISDFMKANPDHAERYYDEIEGAEHHEATE